MSKLTLPAPDVSHAVQDVALADLYPLMREILDGGGSFTLTVTGTSMYPFILGGRDRVTLSPLPKKLRKNDLPLYRRGDGAFVLHRIVRVEKDGTYTMCGDHQTALEKGIRHEQLIAIATAYVRKGRRLTNRNLLYRIYRVLWTWVLPWRGGIFRCRSRLRATAARLLKKNTHQRGTVQK